MGFHPSENRVQNSVKLSRGGRDIETPSFGMVSIVPHYISVLSDCVHSTAVVFPRENRRSDNR